MDKLAVPDKEQEEVLALFTNVKEEIVSKPTLYDRLGGAGKISCIVDDFMTNINQNSILLNNPKLKEGLQVVTAPAHKYFITEYLCAGCGGPQKYSGRPIRASHAGLEISETEWMVFVDEIKMSLGRFRIPQFDGDELLLVVNSLRMDIVRPNALSRSIYDRIGGLGPLSLVMENLVERLRNDAIINGNAAVKEAHGKMHASVYRNVMIQVFGQAFGGPQKYRKSLLDSHKYLKITEKEFNQFLALFEAAMIQVRIPNRELLEIINIVSGMKAQILVA